MKNMFGSTFKETSDGLSGANPERTKAIGRIIITILLLILAGGLLFWMQKDSIGELIIGAIIGYWLK